MRFKSGRKSSLNVIAAIVDNVYILTENKTGLKMIYQVDFLMFEGVLGLDIAGPLEVFHTVNRVFQKNGIKNKGYSFRFLSESDEKIKFNSGLQTITDVKLKNSNRTDIFVIPGGDQVNFLQKNSVFLKELKSKAAKSKKLMCVCEGSFLAASAELLKNKKATTHWISVDRLEKEFPEIKVDKEATYVKDKNIYTSAGVTAGIDLALAIVEEDFGFDIAVEVSRLLVIYYKRPGAQSQFSQSLKNQIDAGEQFSELNKWLIKNLHLQIKVDDMAEFVNMSSRNFARIFKEKTNSTPMKYLESIRLEKAREEIISGNKSFSQIAEDCGFIREERLRKAFMRKFSLTPSQYKLHFNK